MELDLQEGETIYSRAAEEIDARGWAQGWFEVGGKVCIVGALNCVIFGAPFCDGGECCEAMNSNPVMAGHGIAETAMNKLNAETMDERYTTISSWNDATGRTKEEVVELLMRLHEQELASETA